ncbi:MAG: DUF1566 domain-containing protein [Nitrosomonadales bacterium]|nr:DUF1566 domain-containing protein [Nitrosomonadales bacterium]
MKTKKTLLAIALGAGLLSAASAHAALELTLGGQGVYDTDLNVTWLADANLAASNTFGVSGIGTGGYMTWYAAQSWIAGMNASNYLGFSDWRLPTTLQPDATCSIQAGGVSFGYNCTGSEIGHLFYNELGGVAGLSITTTHNANYGLFQNIQSYLYWSGTELGTVTNYALIPGNDGAWFFSTVTGVQYAYNRNYYLFAMAVRPGQVAAVPEPEMVAMLLAGLGLLGFTARRRKQSA